MSPKRLQREGDYEEALSYHVSEYVGALMEGDDFLSGLLMDEIAQTIIGANENRLTKKELSGIILERLNSKVKSVKGRERLASQVEFDVEIEMLKRYAIPKEYREDEEE